MGILIDSSVIIGHERLGSGLDERLAGREEESFFISAISASELLHGVHRARDARTRARRLAFVEAALSGFPVLAADLNVARTHAALWAELTAAGTPVGAHDLWIAATAVAHDLSLATLNRRDFDRVPGLEVEDWSG
ncbi:MAG: type II toxin-antitoxin system VapC family toxin [Gemmatimonadetes bacterium]|nr:type II toxin-antitoxin system VapC family toxin [Gemmatimonadota bacterium]